MCKNRVMLNVAGKSKQETHELILSLNFNQGTAMISVFHVTIILKCYVLMFLFRLLSLSLTVLLRFIKKNVRHFLIINVIKLLIQVIKCAKILQLSTHITPILYHYNELGR